MWIFKTGFRGSSDCPGTCSIDQAGLKFTEIHLPLLPGCVGNHALTSVPLYQGRGMGMRKVSKRYKEASEKNKMENIGSYQEGVPVNTEIPVFNFPYTLYPNTTEGRRKKPALT